MKRIRSIKYSLDKDLKDLGGIWSRIDFKTFIGSSLVITPGRIRLFNSWFRAGCLLQPSAKGIRKKRYVLRIANGGRLPVVMYEPEGLEESAPCLVYYHGGAFVLRDRPATHRLAQVYAGAVGCRVALVQYRVGLPYPEPLKDCYRGLCWIWENAERLGVDRKRIAVLGDSAGGALAAGVTLMARDRKGPEICFQMLISPVTDDQMTSWSMRQFVDSPGWNARLNRQMWKLYLHEDGNGCPRYAAPIRAKSLRGLPPAYVETLEIDCLRDEGNAYADRLARDGVPVELNEIRGTFNGYDVYDKNRLVMLSLKRRCLVLIKELREKQGGNDAGAV
ncbi:MAG TPA: alpha/beta hydrolase [Candidatus Eisenbergiella merdavium]|uniref:Alpha/beta hydrolase n=1 Tax=Candidatus Eisenbergiella merdavium TaxID=2838551 RepID=A0A9D2NJL2_9FIRM|nr:alpha/beta hydrolase [Candidatus Eisenbergiella merdavium]